MLCPPELCPPDVEPPDVDQPPLDVLVELWPQLLLWVWLPVASAMVDVDSKSAQAPTRNRIIVNTPQKDPDQGNCERVWQKSPEKP